MDHLAGLAPIVQTIRQRVDQPKPPIGGLQQHRPAVRTAVVLVKLGEQRFAKKILELSVFRTKGPPPRQFFKTILPL
jgi:hypothetical protein